MRKVSRRLGLPLTSLQSRQLDGHWKDFNHVAQAVRAFMAAQGVSGSDSLPSECKLMRAGRYDLVWGIGCWGRREVARRLGLRLAPNRWDKLRAQ